jgi:hypothetical protein
MNTIATTTSLSVLQFGQVVMLTLEYIFSPKSADVIREYTSTPLLPMNALPQAPSTKNDETKGLLEMNYTRYWLAQIHNRLGSGVFIPKRQRLSDSERQYRPTSSTLKCYRKYLHLSAIFSYVKCSNKIPFCWIS